MSQDQSLTVIDATDAVVLPADRSVAVVVDPAVEAQFSTARQYLQMARLSFAQAAAFMILTGVEFIRIRKRLGETRGKSANVCTFYDACEKHAGVSRRTAANYIQMAEAAKKRLPALNADDLLNTPLGQLPELRRQQLLAAVQKVTDGQTMQQLAWDWGIAKKPSAGGGGDLGGRRKALSAEQTLALVQKLAVEDWSEIEGRLDGYDDGTAYGGPLFGFLNDAVAVETQIAAFERAIERRRDWQRTKGGSL